MTSAQHADRDLKLVSLVNRYATPFAIFLVGTGIVLSSPIGSVRNLSIALMAFSIFLNVIAGGVLRSLSVTMPWIKKARMFANLAVNVVLVYELGPFWPPMWLLLALTPIATAIYEGPAQTLYTSTGISALIVGIHVLRGGNTPHEWGETISYAAFIILLSLLINELTQASYPHHPQDSN